ncbi:Transcriptional adapter ada2 [Rhizoclosmatium hyalinum]|nr:Transcriptional adapter ada2 [Rhizoclosmatium hyalinum]
MPGRDEFDHEFEQDAENPIKDMIFEDNESPEETSLKTTMLNIYNIALDRRMERKKFLRDRNLTHDFKRLQLLEKKRTKEERDLLTRIRVFARLQTSADFDDFTEGLLREQRLRQRIAELQEFRRMGVTTLQGASEYTRDKQQRASYKAAGLAPHRLPGRPAPSARGGPGMRTNSVPSAAPQPPFNPVPGRKMYTPLDISSADGVDLLLPNEQQLCSNIRILPRAYLVIKETLLKEYAEKGGLTRKQARALIKIDVNKTQQIYDLFVINGWIQFAM